jgi:hypothetical protein
MAGIQGMATTAHSRSAARPLGRVKASAVAAAMRMQHAAIAVGGW